MLQKIHCPQVYCIRWQYFATVISKYVSTLHRFDFKSVIPLYRSKDRNQYRFANTLNIWKQKVREINGLWYLILDFNITTSRNMFAQKRFGDNKKGNKNANKPSTLNGR